MRLSGKTALITGGGTGIGLAVAMAYVREGAYVYITGRRENKLQEAVEKIGENAAYVTADVSSRVDMDRVAEKIRNERGQVDIVMANAGVGNYVSPTDGTE